MPPPTNITTLQTFLRLTNNYQVYIANMHDLKTLLNHLLNKRWNWLDKCQISFEEIKKVLSSELLLSYFDLHLEIVVAMHSRESGIEAVM